jgi:hypothetical protein
MTNTLLWTKPSVTCLGDRLMDTTLMSVYAKILNANLHFSWVDCPFVFGDKNPLYEYKPGEKKSWDDVRLKDYKFENFTKYFNIPKNVRIDEPCDPTHTFDESLGGVISPWLFYETFLKHMCEYDEFDLLLTETLQEFKPTKKLLSLVKNNQKPKLSTHLRRTDKINTLGDYSTFMTYDGLEHLDNLTKNVIDKFYNDTDIFYFSSEDKEVLNIYHESYPNHIHHNTNCTDMEKTYIDLYMLSISDYIILSQVHSNFSTFASYLNNSKLIYLYDDSLMTSQKFVNSNHIIHYNKINYEIH